MGLLKNAIGNAVSDGIRKGIGSAMGKAVEKAVTPAAERWANKGAEAIDTATAKMDKDIKETNAAMAEAGAATAEAGAATKEAVNAAGGFAGLEAALSGLASRAESFATSMSANMKVCPSCGQASPADKTFCPHCGAKLPEQTLGEAYKCSQCGTANTPGTKFCSKCGAILPAAEAEIKAQKEKDDQVLAEVAAKLPQFPKWDCGGSEFEFEEAGTQNGYPSYTLRFQATQQEVNAYAAKLIEAGFAKYNAYDHWKVIDGVCRTCNIGEVQDGDAGLYFYVSTIDKKSQPKPQEDPLGDLKGAAKGLFKKILG